MVSQNHPPESQYVKDKIEAEQPHEHVRPVAQFEILHVVQRQEAVAGGERTHLLRVETVWWRQRKQRVGGFGNKLVVIAAQGQSQELVQHEGAETVGEERDDVHPVPVHWDIVGGNHVTAHEHKQDKRN